MTTDITFLTGSARAARPDSSSAKIVAINSSASQRFARNHQQAGNIQADNTQASNTQASNTQANNTQANNTQANNTQAGNTSVMRATQQVNDFIRQTGRNLEFTVDESSGKVIITVRESESGKIIRQIPPQELLSIARLISKNFLSHSVPSGILLAEQS